MTNPNHTDTSRSGDLVELLLTRAHPSNVDVTDRAAARIYTLSVENERLREALRLLHDNIVAAWPSLSELGPVANARAALAGDSHD